MLFFIVSVVGALVPIILLVVTLMAVTIVFGAFVSVLDGLYHPQDENPVSH